MNEHPSAFLCVIYMGPLGVLCLSLGEKKERREKKERHTEILSYAVTAVALEIFVMQILDFAFLRPHMSKEKSLYCSLLAGPEDKIR